MSTLRTIMNPDVVTVGRRMTVRQAADAMRESHVPSAPVMSRGRVVGVVSNDDVALLVPLFANGDGAARDDTAHRLASSGARTGGARSAPNAPSGERDAEARGALPRDATAAALPLSTVLEHVLVEDVMCPRIFALPPEADAGAAAVLMRQSGDQYVLVMEGDLLLGVVYEGDFARTQTTAFAETRITPSRIEAPHTESRERNLVPPSPSAA